MPQKGEIKLLPLLVVALLVVVAALFFLISRGIVSNPVPGIIKVPTSSVELKPEYENPLDKEAQYTNPFSDYKNPFDAIK